MLADSLPAMKRRRFAIADPMAAQFATEKVAAAKQNYGREIRVFETATEKISQRNQVSWNSPQKIITTSYLPKRKINILRLKRYEKQKQQLVDQELPRFPDNHTLEATFHPSETMQSLVDLLLKVVARPDLPFYTYTVPPKKQIKDMSQDFYSAGFAPGAIVYFSYDPPQGDDITSSPFLKEDVMSLKGLELIPEQKPEAYQPATEPVVASGPPPRKPAAEKMVKPR